MCLDRIVAKYSKSILCSPIMVDPGFFLKNNKFCFALLFFFLTLLMTFFFSTVRYYLGGTFVSTMKEDIQIICSCFENYLTDHDQQILQTRVSILDKV